jgi:sugar/nucleoside kinase (ribokinase family)
LLGPSFDVITAGRVVVDLYPRERGVRLPEVRTFSKSLGGSPTNVAVQAARLGSRTAIFGGALAHALAHRWDIDQALKLANAAGALAASRFACADDYGTLTEITDLLSSSGPNSCIRHSSPDNYGLDGRPRAAVGDSP